MKKLLTVLVLIAGSVFIATPAFSDDTAPPPADSSQTQTQPADTAPAAEAPAPAAPAPEPVTVVAPAPEPVAAPAAADTSSSGSTPATTKSTSKVSKPDAQVDDPKHFVCKYTGTPGVNEALQTGNNPISVGTPDLTVGSYFTDSQGRSYVLAEDTGQAEPDVSLCPPPDTGPVQPQVIPYVNPTLTPSPACEVSGSIALPANTANITYAFVIGSATMTSGNYDITATIVDPTKFTFVGGETVHHFVGMLVPATDCVVVVDHPAKVFVCKYVGKPGVDERLQTGNNPISVSVNAIPGPGPVQIGYEFADKQGRSVVIAFDTGQDPEPSIADCMKIPVPPTKIVPTGHVVKPAEVGALPDTGGPQLGLIPLGAMLLIAGGMVVGRRRMA